MTNNIDKQSFGRAGAVYATDGQTKTGNFCALQFLSATTLAAITWPQLEGTFPTTEIPAGTVIYGNITAFEVTTGDVLAYKASS